MTAHLLRRVRPVEGGCRAECSCGWLGPLVGSDRDAVLGLRMHRAAKAERVQ